MNNRIKKAKIKIILTLLSTILLIIIALVCLPKLPLSNMQSEHFWANKLKQDSCYDVVIIGDSRIYRGINPTIIEKEMGEGVSVFNFGFSSAGLDSSLILNGVKKLITNGKKIIIIGVSANSFSKSILVNEHFNTIAKMPKKDLWVKQNIYPYLNGFERYSLSDLKKFYLKQNYYNHFNDNGFVASEKYFEDSTEALASYIEFYKKNRKEKPVLKPFISTLKKLTDNGYTIYCFRLPTSFAMQKLEDTSSLLNFIELKQILQQQGVKWIDLKQKYKSYDGSHLATEEANKLSKEIGLFMNNQ